MSNELTSSVYGQPITLRFGMPLQTGHKTISLIREDGTAASQVFTYDPAAKVMDTDWEKLVSMIFSFGSKKGSLLSVAIWVSDLIVGIVNGIAKIFRTVLGGFVGFGWIGILIVLALMAVSFAISYYAFLIAAPFLLLSYGLRFYKDRLVKGEAKRLSASALQLFEQSA